MALGNCHTDSFRYSGVSKHPCKSLRIPTSQTNCHSCCSNNPLERFSFFNHQPIMHQSIKLPKRLKTCLPLLSFLLPRLPPVPVKEISRSRVPRPLAYKICLLPSVLHEYTPNLDISSPIRSKPAPHLPSRPIRNMKNAVIRSLRYCYLSSHLQSAVSSKRAACSRRLPKSHHRYRTVRDRP